jgi:hypothetical protein
MSHFKLRQILHKHVYLLGSSLIGVVPGISDKPFKDEAQTALFKYPVRTAQ